MLLNVGIDVGACVGIFINCWRLSIDAIVSSPSSSISNTSVLSFIEDTGTRPKRLKSSNSSIGLSDNGAKLSSSSFNGAVTISSEEEEPPFCFKS